MYLLFAVLEETEMFASLSTSGVGVGVLCLCCGRLWETYGNNEVATQTLELLPLDGSVFSAKTDVSRWFLWAFQGGHCIVVASRLSRDLQYVW